MESVLMNHSSVQRKEHKLPTAVVEETVLSLLNGIGTFVKDYLTI